MSEETGNSPLGGNALMQMMGILNVFRTGNPQVDMVLTMCLPILIRFLIGKIEDFDEVFTYKYWARWFRRNEHEGWHNRIVSHTTSKNARGRTFSDEDNQNTVLLKAIQLYLHNHADLRLRDANLDLTSLEDKNSSLGRRNYYNDDNDDDGSSRTVVGILSKYKIIKKPPQNTWHSIGRYGDPVPSPVKLRIEMHEERSRGEENGIIGTSNKIHTYNFISPDGAAIDAFIDTAYKWYMGKLRQAEDNARYLYELKASPCANGVGNRDGDSGGSEDDDVVKYTRFRLSDEKTFDSLFFQEKETLLNLIEHFKNKTGKYAIKGYPHKLGILLHGPPGSGKTSMIKALAQHTGRSIINVPLAKVSTNSELMSIFFDRKKYVDGEYVPVKLGFKDAIFVMEDIDAASKVVKRRDGKTAAQVAEEEVAANTRAEFSIPPPKSMWRMLLESQDRNCKELVKLLMEKSDRLKKEAVKPDLVMSMARKMTSLQGLSVVGETGNDHMLRAIERDTLNAVNATMRNASVMDRFVGKHARKMITMIEAGTEVSDDLVDELLSQELSPKLADDTTLTSSTSSSSLSSMSSRVRQESEKKEDNVLSHREVFLAEMAKTLEDAKALDGGSSSSEAEGTQKTTSLAFALNKVNKDQLNLTGLLNVMDGVVDSPGRIIIMTTNHVEHLDPALIRPGRIDKKLLLGYMNEVDVVAMLQHYFQLTLSEEQQERVERAVSGKNGRGEKVDSRRLPVNLTPAQVEQLTAEHDDIDDMIRALEEKGRRIIQ